ncbi:MAG: OmpH family outer membrane protein [bacterium]|uniref:OmpH family outer membrane protein n=1 Tax=Candidatus Methylomirabilis tolerans TaxID=3123416 RepID=A0AAJ1AHK1_9BACT|nr:OmpH family outer membrane protein [Candidatus Methylomirabilis sp.]
MMKTISTVVRFFSECSIAYLIAGIALTVPSAASGQEPSKIGVLDFREVALGSKAGKAAKARLDKLAEKLKKEMKTEQTKLLARRKDLEAAAPRLTSAEQQARTAALEQGEAVLQRLLEDKTEELKDAETKSIQELADRIDPILSAYITEKGFSLILEARRPGLLYFDKHLDISAEIIKRFNRTSK